MTILASLVALLAIWSWPWRGGSVWPKAEFSGNRFVTLLATPLIVGLALAIGIGVEDGYDAVLLALAVLLLTACSADGWGRQMDLGRDSKPDDERWYEIRDKLFKEKSSFWRDLTGLYMRFAQFKIVIVPLAFYDLKTVIVPIAVFCLAPLAWVIEFFVWYRRGKVPSVPAAELMVGGIFAGATILAVLL